jgi:hypothetical protein
MPSEKDSEGTSGFEEDVPTTRKAPDFQKDVPTAGGTSDFRDDMPTARRPSGFESRMPTARIQSLLAGADDGVPKQVGDEVTMPVSTEELIAGGRRVVAHLDDLSALFDSRLTPESLPPGYEKMINVLRTFDILRADGEAKQGDTPPLSIERVQAAFSAERLQLASALKKPILLLTPNSTVISTIIAMRRTIGKFGIRGIEINKDLSDRLPAGMDKITSWSVSIVEGAPTIEGNASEQSPIGSMTLQQYLMLVIATANDGGIDRKSVTLIKDPLLKKGEVIQAFVSDGILNLNLVKTDEEAPFPSHFRPSVDGNIPPATKE